MIIDCFMFSNENEVAKLRIAELYNHVDYFLIVESDKVHLTGENRELRFLNIGIDKKYYDKIIYKPITLNQDSPWGRENENRYKVFDCIKESFPDGSIKQLSDNDLILISDCDEIPNWKTFEQARKYEFCFFDQMFFVYYFNFYSGKNVTGTAACKYTKLNQIQGFYGNSFQWLRNNKDYGIEILDGGWHLSYMGNPEEITKKARSIAEGGDYKKETFEYQIKTAIESGHCPYSNQRIQILDSEKQFSFMSGIKLRFSGETDFSDILQVFPDELFNNQKSYRKNIYSC